MATNSCPRCGGLVAAIAECCLLCGWQTYSPAYSGDVSRVSVSVLEEIHATRRIRRSDRPKQLTLALGGE